MSKGAAYYRVKRYKERTSGGESCPSIAEIIKPGLYLKAE